MGRASDVLIPARFLFTVGHFVAIVLAFYQVVSTDDAVSPVSCRQVYDFHQLAGRECYCRAHCVAELIVSGVCNTEPARSPRVRGSLPLYNCYGVSLYWFSILHGCPLPRLQAGCDLLHRRRFRDLRGLYPVF